MFDINFNISGATKALPNKVTFSPESPGMDPLPVEVTMRCEFNVTKERFFVLTWKKKDVSDSGVANLIDMYTRAADDGPNSDATGPSDEYAHRIKETTDGFHLSTDITIKNSYHEIKLNATLCDGRSAEYQCVVSQYGSTPITLPKTLTFTDGQYVSNLLFHFL